MQLCVRRVWPRVYKGIAISPTPTRERPLKLVRERQLAGMVCQHPRGVSSGLPPVASERRDQTSHNEVVVRSPSQIPWALADGVNSAFGQGRASALYSAARTAHDFALHSAASAAQPMRALMTAPMSHRLARLPCCCLEQAMRAAIQMGCHWR